MSLVKLILLIIFISNFGQYSCLRDQSLNKILIEIIERDLTKQNKTENKHDNSIKVCQPNVLFDRVSSSIMPDDYEVPTKENVYEDIEHINDTVSKLERIQTWINNVSTKMENVQNRIMMRVMEKMMEEDIPDECRTSLTRIGNGISNKESWALQYTEVFQLNHFTINNGILSLPNTDYDECLLFQSPETNDNSPVISGQYCTFSAPDILPKNLRKQLNTLNETLIQMVQDKFMANNTFESPRDLGSSPENKMLINKRILSQAMDTHKWSKGINLKLPFGICLPRSCDPKDIENAINKALYPIIRLPVAINPDCDYKDKPIILRPHQIFTMSLFTILTALVIIGTMIDLHVKYFEIDTSKPSLITEIGHCFSAIANFKRLFKRRQNNKYSLFDGVRTLLSFHVLNMHTHLGGMFRTNSKGIDRALYNDRTNPFKYFAERNINFIDIFFMIGGLATYEEAMAILKHTKGRFNYSQFVIFRYFRIIPPLIGAITLFYLFPLVGDGRPLNIMGSELNHLSLGPLWSGLSEVLYDQCTNHWMSSVFMTSNIVAQRPDSMSCNYVTWYISADFHLRLLSPIIILFIYKFPRCAIPYFLIWIIIGTIIPLYPKVLMGMPYFMENFVKTSLWDIWDSFIYYYNRTEQHIVAYIMGIFVSFLINKYPNVYLGGRVGEFFIWVTTCAMTFSSMIWANLHYQWDYKLGYTELLLFFSMSKLLHIAGWVWLTFACATGRAGLIISMFELMSSFIFFSGFVNKFFSSSVFTSTSNLSYEIMLLHSLLIYYRLGSARSTIQFSFYNVTTMSSGDYFFTYLLSIIFYILLSRPFLNLLNLYLKSISRSKRKTNSN